jgi:hypothetical protein
MISKACPPRNSGRGSFGALRSYLELADDGTEREDFIASWSGNVASHDTADLEMDLIGRLGRTPDPVFHVMMSWRPGEDVSLETARGAVEAALVSLGAERHQWFAAMHDDGERIHVHLGINRVDPETRNLLDVWQCNAKLARAAEWTEREFGCRADRRMDWRAEGLAEWDLGAKPEQVAADTRRRLDGVPPGARRAEMDAAHRAGYSWVSLVSREAVPAVLETSARTGATWLDLHATLESYGLRMEQAGSGARIVGAEPGQHMKASRVGLKVRELEKRLGPYEEPPREPTEYELRLASARETVKAARSWTEVHEGLAALGFALDDSNKGGRLVDLEHDGRKLGCKRALGASLGQLKKRLGDFELSPEMLEQQQREEVRRAAAIAERAEFLEQQPGLVIECLTEKRSTWERYDVECEVREMLSVPEGVDETIKRVAAAALASKNCILLGSLGEDERGEERAFYSTAEIIKAEDDLHKQADGLAARRHVAHVRAPSDTLDAQQREAFQALTEGRGLSLITGIAGAGKSRMLRDASAAYQEAEFPVIGCAVSGDAARVLGDEAKIKTQTVAALRIALQNDRERLDGRTVLIVDEASMLGTDDALTLLRYANEQGAQVRFVGDASQHGSVARGAVLEDLTLRHG